MSCAAQISSTHDCDWACVNLRLGKTSSVSNSAAYMRDVAIVADFANLAAISCSLVAYSSYGDTSLLKVVECIFEPDVAKIICMIIGYVDYSEAFLKQQFGVMGW